MILTLDIGNSNIVVSGIRNFKTIFSGRIKTDKNYSEEDIASHIDFIFKLNKVNAGDFKGAVVSSVVPCVTEKTAFAAEKLIGKKAYIVGKDIDFGIDIKMDNPDKVGEDMLVDAAAALYEYEPPMLILASSNISSSPASLVFLSKRRLVSSAFLILICSSIVAKRCCLDWILPRS